jgi:transcriptional regulator with XRE-family HTH domain
MQQELREALSLRIRAYLDAHPRSTLRSIAKRSGLSTMTVSRLAQGEVAKPSFESTVALIGVIADRDDVSAFLAAHFPDTMDSVARVYKENASLLNHEDVEQFLADPLRFTVFDLASMDAGTSRAIIAEEFGKTGLKALESLLQSGILYEDGKGQISYANGLNYVAINANDIIRRLQIRLESFQVENLGTRAARLASISESLNEEGMHKIHQILTECIDKIQEIRQDRVYKGTIPVYLGLFMNLVMGSASSHRPGNEIRR